MTSPQDKPPVNPIAIIAVHGVADQLPYDSARQIAQMLLDYSAARGDRAYADFIETQLHLPETRFTFNPDHPQNDTSYSFLNQQLNPENGCELKPLETLSTVRLEGDRQLSSSSQNSYSQPVHIYEMYWADLSRLQNEFFRVFGEFYQLLFHLSRIGNRQVTGLKRTYQPESQYPRIWTLYARCQKWAEQSLTLAFPLLNFVMIVSALIIVPCGLIPEPILPMMPAVVVILALAALIGEFVWQFSGFSTQKLKQSMWATISKLKSKVAIVLGGFSLLSLKIEALGEYRYLAVLSGAVLVAIELWIAGKYDNRRPNAMKIARWLNGLWAILLIVLLSQAPNTWEGIVQTCLKLILFFLGPLLLAWSLFNLGQIIAWFCGYFLTYTEPKSKVNSKVISKIRRGAWTARLSLSLSSALFLLVTMTVWYTFTVFSQKLLEVSIDYVPVGLTKLIGADSCVTSSSLLHVDCFVKQLLITASTSFFGSVLLILAIPLIVGAIAFLPSLLAEIFPTISSGDEESKQRDNPIKDRGERWLSRGLTWLYGATEIFTFVMILFAVLNIWMLGLKFMESSSLPVLAPLAKGQLSFFKTLTSFGMSPLSKFSPDELLPFFTILIVSSATSLVALGSRLAKFTSGIRDLLDVVLDVDSYLRVHPRGDNPKARIFNRYTSLIRYLCNSPLMEQKYDAIIIISHSQGTVITADLLRVLQVSYKSLTELDPELQTFANANVLPVYLYTMGSPLRQLYSMAFPTLYGWMDNLPSARSFGLTQWKNVYCSGDYVGRALVDSDNDKPEQFDEDCIGSGAHTHYWDNIRPEVAKGLDDLIVAIARAGITKQ